MWALGAADKTRFSRKFSEAEILARTHYFKVYSIDLERWYGFFLTPLTPRRVYDWGRLVTDFAGLART